MSNFSFSSTAYKLGTNDTPDAFFLVFVSLVDGPNSLLSYLPRTRFQLSSASYFYSVFKAFNNPPAPPFLPPPVGA